MTFLPEALAMFEEIDEYLLRCARKLHHRHWPQVDPDDFHQEMRLWFFERWGNNPEVSQHSRGYYSQGAVWHCQHWARHEYTRFHKGERIAWADPLPEWWQEAIG